MKRLFVVKLVSGTAGKGMKRGVVLVPGEIRYFDNKADAREARDSLMEKYPKGVFCVSPGPDHRKGRS